MMEQQDHPKKFSRILLLSVAILAIAFVIYDRQNSEFYSDNQYSDNQNECLTSAIDAGNGNKLGICDYHIFDNRGEAVVYDSSDQIILCAGLAAKNPDIVERIPLKWRQAYKKLPLPNIGGDYGLYVTPIKGKKHFYKIIWS